MRHIVAIVSILFIATALFAQKKKKPVTSAPWHDTSFVLVKLNNTLRDNKIVAVDIGKKATIFVKLTPVLAEAKQRLSNDFLRSYYDTIIHFLDSAALETDTIFLDEYNKLQYFEYLVSHQLSKGEVRVLYKKQKLFVDTISHRLERYGGNADRFFYLPDKRPFFAVTEFSGILEPTDDLLKGHFDDYAKEGEKLLSLREE